MEDAGINGNMVNGLGLDNIKADLLCPVCGEKYVDPRVIPCKHVLCMRCVKALLQPGDQLLCPVCMDGEKFKLHHNANDLPEPVSIRQLKSKVKRLLTSFEDAVSDGLTCRKCNKVATYMCLTCDKLSGFCPFCRTAHSPDHNTVRISRWSFCVQHLSERALSQGYCKTCKEGVCRECMDNDHADHDVVADSDYSHKLSRRRELERLSGYYRRDLKHFTAYAEKNRKSMAELRSMSGEAKVKLDDLRAAVNATIDNLHRDIDEQYKAESEKLRNHGNNIEKIKQMTETLLIYIKELQNRNAPGDIDVAVDVLKGINVNTCPKRPKIVHTVVEDYEDVISRINELVVTEEAVSTIARAPGFYNTWTSHAPATSVCWDELDKAWWVRVHDSIRQYTTRGKLLRKVGKGRLVKNGHICIDTKRNRLVTTDNSERILVISKDDELIREITVPNYGSLTSLAYCQHRDRYVVVDRQKHCLWFVGAEAGQIQGQVGSEGEDTNQLLSPGFVSHFTTSPISCCYVITDSGNHCLKVLNPGDFYGRRLGFKGLGVAGGLHWPYGSSVDAQGQIVVCDTNNKRVVCYRGDDEESWGVLFDEEQLGGRTPVIIGIASDGQHMLVGTQKGPSSKTILIKGFTYRS